MDQLKKMIDLWLISDVFRKFRIFTVFEGSLDTSDIFLTNFGNRIRC